MSELACLEICAGAGGQSKTAGYRQIGNAFPPGPAPSPPALPSTAERLLRAV